MKKTLLTFILLSSVGVSFSQTINYGLKAGVNLSEQNRSSAYNYQSNFRVGMNAGGMIDISFQQLSIQPGVFFTMKGDSGPAETTLDYIEVPVNFLYKFKIATASNIHLGGGPYIAYGISESIMINGKNFPTTPSFTFKNPDYGVNFVAGLTLKKILIDASYGLGVANIDSNGLNTHNSIISLSIGYLFR
jgi:Outer membrane protein beta-barrel domain